MEEPVSDSASAQHPLITSLQGDKATWAFVRECMRHKGTDRVFNATEEAMRKVSEALLSRHGIQVSAADCKTKKKRLDEQHRRAPHEAWGKHWAFVQGEKKAENPDDQPGFSQEVDVDFAHSRPGTSMEDDVLAVTKFTKGAKMQPHQMHALIDVWRLFKEEYWRAHKDSVFYKKVSAQMVLRGHLFSPDQCKTKMNDLVSDFKLYVKALKRTGQGRPKPWAFYVELQPILECMVSVEAEHTFAVGAVSESTHKPHFPSTQTSSERYGQVRPPAESKKDEKKEMLKQIVDSRLQLAQELREFMKSRKDNNNN